MVDKERIRARPVQARQQERTGNSKLEIGGKADRSSVISAHPRFRRLEVWNKGGFARVLFTLAYRFGLALSPPYGGHRRCARPKHADQ